MLPILALVLQLADAAVTCHTLRNGGRELNPLLPKTCAGIVGVKAASLVTIPLTPSGSLWRRAVVTFNVASGGVGVGVTLVLKARD